MAGHCRQGAGGIWGLHTSAPRGGSQGAAPTQGLSHRPAPLPAATKETPTARKHVRGDTGRCSHRCLPHGSRAPLSLPSVRKSRAGNGQQPGGHVEALWHPHGAPGQMAPAARPVPALITDALIFQTGTRNPGSVVSSMDLITDAGLIGQFPAKPVIKLQGWRVLGEDELGQELPVRLLTRAPNQAAGHGMGRDWLWVQHKGADPFGKGMQVLGMYPNSSTCPADLTQKHQCLSQCQTRPKGTVVTVPICRQTRSQPVHLAVGAMGRGRGGWGPSVSRSRSEPSSETLRLQHCWGQGTVTQPRRQHPLPAHRPARCHHPIPTWASRPEPGLLPPRAGHRGQMAPGVQGRGRLRPTAPPPLLLLLAPGPAWATRRGSEMRRPAAHSELPPTGCGIHRATAPRGHPWVSEAGGQGGLPAEETARSHLFLAEKPLCPSSVCQPPASPGPSAGQPVPPADAGL